MIGWCGLKYHPESQLVDLGYRLYRTQWGKGYATEAARLSIQYGFETLRLKRIVAHVHRDNVASHQVALKCGMIFKKDFLYEGQPARLYEIRR